MKASKHTGMGIPGITGRFQKTAQILLADRSFGVLTSTSHLEANSSTNSLHAQNSDIISMVRDIETTNR